MVNRRSDTDFLIRFCFIFFVMLLPLLLHETDVSLLRETRPAGGLKHAAPWMDMIHSSGGRASRSAPFGRGGTCNITSGLPSFITHKHAAGSDVYHVRMWNPGPAPAGTRLVQFCPGSPCKSTHHCKSRATHVNKEWRAVLRAADSSDGGLFVSPLRIPTRSYNGFSGVPLALAREVLRCDVTRKVHAENSHLLMDACASELGLACDHNLTVLTPAAAARGTEVEGDGRMIGCLMQRLRAGASVTVATLGGSASAPYSWSRHPAMKYPYQLVDALSRRFAFSTIRSHNGAIAATGPGLFEHCLRQQLPPFPDLVLVEFALNTPPPEHAAFERMLRYLLQLCPSARTDGAGLFLPPQRPAIVVVNLHNFHGSEAAMQTYEPRRALDEAETAILHLCEHYGVPMVSLRAALFDRAMRPPRMLRWDWPRSILERDGYNKHPNLVGHAFLAELILARLQAALTAVQPAEADSACAVTCRPPPLPEPLLPGGNEGSGPSLCARGLALGPYVLESSGFDMTDEGRNKFGLVGLRAGARVSMLLSNGSVPKELRLAYLASYEGMGSADIQCAGTCACAARIDAHAPRADQNVSITAQVRIHISPASNTQRHAVPHRQPGPPSHGGACILELRIPAETSSSGHKFKLIALLIGLDGVVEFDRKQSVWYRMSRR